MTAEKSLITLTAAQHPRLRRHRHRSLQSESRLSAQKNQDSVRLSLRVLIGVTLIIAKYKRPILVVRPCAYDAAYFMYHILLSIMRIPYFIEYNAHTIFY
jgi:hypothetical protein